MILVDALIKHEANRDKLKLQDPLEFWIKVGLDVSARMWLPMMEKCRIRTLVTFLVQNVFLRV